MTGSAFWETAAREIGTLLLFSGRSQNREIITAIFALIGDEKELAVCAFENEIVCPSLQEGN